MNNSTTQYDIHKLYTYYVVEHKIMSKINFKVYAVKILLRMHPNMSLLEAMNVINSVEKAK